MFNETEILEKLKELTHSALKEMKQEITSSLFESGLKSSLGSQISSLKSLISAARERGDASAVTELEGKLSELRNHKNMAESAEDFPIGAKVIHQHNARGRQGKFDVGEVKGHSKEGIHVQWPRKRSEMVHNSRELLHAQEHHINPKPQTEDDINVIRRNNPHAVVHSIGAKVTHHNTSLGKHHLNGVTGIVQHVEDHGAGHIAHYVRWPGKRSNDMHWGSWLKPIGEEKVNEEDEQLDEVFGDAGKIPLGHRVKFKHVKSGQMGYGQVTDKNGEHYTIRTDNGKDYVAHRMDMVPVVRHKADAERLKKYNGLKEDEDISESFKKGDKVIVHPPSYPNMKHNGVIIGSSKHGADFHRVEYETDGMLGGKVKRKETFHAKNLEKLEEHIVKTGSEFELKSHKGKNLGKFKTKTQAVKREREVEYFKHMKEAAEKLYIAKHKDEDEEDKIFSSQSALDTYLNKHGKENFTVTHGISKVDHKKIDENEEHWHDIKFKATGKNITKKHERLFDDLFRHGVTDKVHINHVSGVGNFKAHISDMDKVHKILHDNKFPMIKEQTLWDEKKEKWLKKSTEDREKEKKEKEDSKKVNESELKYATHEVGSDVQLRAPHSPWNGMVGKVVAHHITNGENGNYKYAIHQLQMPNGHSYYAHPTDLVALDKDKVHESETHYHSVWQQDKGDPKKWYHQFDADNKEDARHEHYSLRNSGFKAKVLRVKKDEADWRNPEHLAKAIARLNETNEEINSQTYKYGKGERKGQLETIHTHSDGDNLYRIFHNHDTGEIYTSMNGKKTDTPTDVHKQMMKKLKISHPSLNEADNKTWHIKNTHQEGHEEVFKKSFPAHMNAEDVKSAVKKELEEEGNIPKSIEVSTTKEFEARQ